MCHVSQKKILDKKKILDADEKEFEFMRALMESEFEKPCESEEAWELWLHCLWDIESAGDQVRRVREMAWNLVQATHLHDTAIEWLYRKAKEEDPFASRLRDEERNAPARGKTFSEVFLNCLGTYGRNAQSPFSAPFRNYLSAAIKNSRHEQGRQEEREQRYTRQLPAPIQQSAGTEESEESQESDRSEEIEILSVLPDVYQKIFRMKMENKSYQEIGEILGKSGKHVGVLAYRAKKLARDLQDSEEKLRKAKFLNDARKKLETLRPALSPAEIEGRIEFLKAVAMKHEGEAGAESKLADPEGIDGKIASIKHRNHRQVAEMFYLGGLSQNEIAEKLGIEKNLVKQWIYRARKTCLRNEA